MEEKARNCMLQMLENAESAKKDAEQYHSLHMRGLEMEKRREAAAYLECIRIIQKEFNFV